MRVGALVALAVALPLPAHAESLSLGEKRAIAMVVTSPRGVSVPLASSTAYRLAQEVLAGIGPITVQTPEQSGFDQELLAICPLEERLRCYAETMGRARRGKEPRFLAVVALLPFGKTAKVTSLVMDLDAALALDSTGDNVEDRIFREATVTADAIVSLPGESELKAHLAKLFGAARSFFASSGYDQPSGRIELVGGEGFSLELDGRALGILAGPSTTLAEVLPGSRKLELEDPNRRLLPFNRTVLLEPGTALSLQVPRLQDPALVATIDPLHRVTFWGGVGLAVIGSALTVWAIAAWPDAKRVGICTDEDCARAGSSFASFCELTSARPSDCSGGVLAAPLGLGLFGAGGGTALLTELLVPPEQAPWWPPLIGLATGIVLYGLLAVVK